MKVLIALLSVGFAGTERHAIELANALAGRCEVALLLRDRPREAHRQAAYDVLRGAVGPGLRVFLASRALPVLGLAAALLRFRPDLIHAHHNRSARIAARWSFGVPVLATIHMHFRARDFGRCDGVICLTEAEAAALPADYRGQRFVIGNWVLPHPKPTAARVAALRAEFGLAAGDYVVGTVARLEPMKAVSLLLDALARAALPAAKLVIVGEGSERAALERQAAALGMARRTVFTGFRADVRDLYAVFDLFVLSSRDEPYGLAILEAAAAGLPVIATATIGATAIAARLPMHLVPVGGRPELTEALVAAAADRPAGPATLSGFEIAARTTEILAAYRSVIAAARPGGGQTWPAMRSRRVMRSDRT